MKRERLVSPGRGAGDARPPAPRRPGRPRSEEAHAAILAASVDLIREVGYDAVTIDGIAARAGVGKATVYRRWSSKETLVADAIQGIVRQIPVPDTGSTVGDLEAMLGAAARMYADPATGPLLSGLIAAMARNGRIADAVRSGFVATFTAALARVLERGVARGDLRADLDVPVALDVLLGPLLYRYLIEGGTVDERLTRGVVAVAARGLAPAPAPAPRAPDDPGVHEP